MTGTTDRLSLPLIAAGQAQKEMTHNEALAALDIAVQPVIEDAGRDTPPEAPAPGQCWIVGGDPTGAWAEQAGALACWTASGWRFLEPDAGWSAWSKGDNLPMRHDGEGWITGVVTAERIEIDGVQVLSARQPAIAAPAGGTVIDIQARAVLSQIINSLMAHGLIAT